MLRPEGLKAKAEQLSAVLDLVMTEALRVLTCPWAAPLWDGLTSTDEEWMRAVARVAAAERLLRASNRIETQFASLNSWLEAGWLEARRKELEAHYPITLDFKTLLARFQRLAPYQQFRQAGLTRPVRAIFDTLLSLRKAMDGLSLEDRRAAVNALIRREAAFDWAEQLRSERGILASPPTKIEGDVDQWRNRDAEMRTLNQRLLGIIDPRALSPVQQWAQIWQVSGNRVKRLRSSIRGGPRSGSSRCAADLAQPGRGEPHLSARTWPVRRGNLRRSLPDARRERRRGPLIAVSGR